jgi:hypothetical protein
MLLSDAPRERPDIQNGDEHRQSCQTKANQPINQVRHAGQRAFEKRLAAKQHSDRPKEDDSANPAPPRSRAKSHVFKLTKGRERGKLITDN